MNELEFIRARGTVRPAVPSAGGALVAFTWWVVVPHATCHREACAPCYPEAQIFRLNSFELMKVLLFDLFR